MEEINSSKTEKGSLVLVMILFIFLFFWYAQLTDISRGPLLFVKDSFTNLGNIFNEDVQVEGNSPLQNILLFSKKVDYSKEWIEYNSEIKENYNRKFDKSDFYSQEKISETRQSLRMPKGLEPKVSYNLNISFIKTLLEFLGRAFITLGIFFFFIYSRKKAGASFLNIISISFLCFLIITVFLPFFSIYYDLPRFYQQFLIILSLFSPLGLLFILKPFCKEKSYIILALFFVLYFIIFSGLVYQLTGGISAATSLNNVGFEYDTKYVHQSELNSALWLLGNKGAEAIYLDSALYRKSLLLGFSTMENDRFNDIILSIVQKKAYILSSYTNKMKQITTRIFQMVAVPYNFPDKFLNDNKNKIYSNGESEIFK